MNNYEGRNVCKITRVIMHVQRGGSSCTYNYEGLKKVLSLTKILDLTQTSHLRMSLNCTEIKIENWISFSSFIRIDSILP